MADVEPAPAAGGTSPSYTSFHSLQATSTTTGRQLSFPQHRESVLRQRFAVGGALVLAAVMVLVVTGCEGEGGLYCSKYGHRELMPWSKIYEVHKGTAKL